MTGALLKSARLTYYHAVGAVGNPVYLAASQLRAAIARRLGPEVADVFAVPQRNEDGDTVDWYAPKPGTVVPWSAATESERDQARQQLLEVRERIETLARAMQAETLPERQVFGRLLAQMVQFPDDQDVHLVDGRPVLTFWGFVKDKAAVGSDPLRNLDRHRVTPLAPARRPWWHWLLLALLLLLLLISLLWALRAWDTSDIQSLETPPSTQAKDERRLTGAESEDEPMPATGFADRDAAIPADPEMPSAPDAVDQGNPDPTRIEVQGDRTLIDRDGERLVVDGNSDVLGDGSAIAPAADEILLDDAIVEDGAAVGDAVATDVDRLDAAEVDPAEVDPQAAEQGEADLSGAEGLADLAELEAPGDADETAAADANAQPADTDRADALEPADSADAATEDMTDTTAADASPPASEADRAGEQDEDRAKPNAAASAESGAKSGAKSGAEPEAKPAVDQAAASDAPRGIRGPAPVRIPRQQLLNSGWRTSMNLADPKDGSPVRLGYRLQDGRGTIQLTRKDGSVCESDISGDARADGRLVIDTKRAILCDDNTSFGRPRIECMPQQGGQARCVGRYADGTSFPIDMQRDADVAPGAPR